MANQSNTVRSGSGIWALYSFINLIYTIVVYGFFHLATLWNLFIPYTLAYDLVIKFAPLIHR